MKHNEFLPKPTVDPARRKWRASAIKAIGIPAVAATAALIAPTVHNPKDPMNERTAALEAQIFGDTNAYRQAQGLSPLHHEIALHDDACVWSAKMAARDPFHEGNYDHKYHDAGKSGMLVHYGDLASDIGPTVPNWEAAGENVGVSGGVGNSIQSARVIGHGLSLAYYNSPGHRANMLGDYTSTDVCAVIDDIHHSVMTTTRFVRTPQPASEQFDIFKLG